MKTTDGAYEIAYTLVGDKSYKEHVTTLYESIDEIYKEYVK